MEHDRYTFRVTLDAGPAAVAQRIRETLADVGFGALTEIDVQTTLRDKLGACVPPGRWDRAGRRRP